jgi:hypothetical protein
MLLLVRDQPAAAQAFEWLAGKPFGEKPVDGKIPNSKTQINPKSEIRNNTLVSFGF